jgi:nucleolar GTP-binding protein
MTAEEILQSAFHRASKITVPNADPFTRLKLTEQSRVRSAQNSIASTLQGYVKKFPSFDGLPPFYQDLAGVLLDMDAVRKALGSLDWAWKRVNEIGDEAIPQMKRGRHAYGRISSILKQVDKHLKLLDEARRDLRRLPVIETTLPTIVVAGYPNVGKSSLVRKVSSGTPEVANYPFTTKGVVLGHFEHRHVKHQIVDTPGLLDRDMSERNDIEMQAIHALRHLGDVIVFLVDPSEHCGYTLDAQLKLLDDVKPSFPDTPFVVAESKADLKTSGAGEVAFSSETGDGIEDLMKVVLGRMRKRA